MNAFQEGSKSILLFIMIEDTPSYSKSSNIPVSLPYQLILSLAAFIPDGLLHEAVRILGYKCGECRLGRHALIQSDESGIGVEVRALVDVDDADRDCSGGLAWKVDASL